MRWRSPRRSSPAPSCERTGLRRTDWVRITIGDGEPSAEAVGVGHRLPASAPITIPLALALTASGVPLVVHARPARAALNTGPSVSPSAA
jgi:hypothetical protein